MSTPDTLQNAQESNAAQAAVHDAHESASTSATANAASAPNAASSDQADRSGSESGNDDGAHDGDDGNEGGDAGSAEGGEGAAAGATGPGAPGQTGTGKKRRRRRKGKGPRPGDTLNADGTVAASGENAEGATGEGGEAVEGAQATGDQAGKKDGKRRRDRGPRPAHDGRERPAFNVGEQVFGRILDINDDAVLIDLAGKGLALFDRMEMDIVDEPATPAEAREHAEAEAAADAEHGEHAAHDDAASAATNAADASGASNATDNGVAPTKGEVISAVVAAVTEAVVDAAKTVVEAATAVAAAPSEPAAATTEESAEGSATAEGAATTEGTTEATAAAKEPQAPLPPIVLEVGANFVGYIHNDGGRGGLVVVTRHPKRASKIKPVIAQAFKERTIVKGLVTGVIKGGAEVDLQGLRAFAPGSHMDARPGADLTPLLARRLDFYVTQYAKRGRDVVLTRKPFLEAEARANREAALSKLTPGSTVDGVVRSVVQFGAFIDVGGVEGLVPLAEMSHNRSDGPHDVFKVGETVPVKIIRIDEKGKIWLSRRATTPDPWAAAAKKYSVGSRHQGKVVRLQPFGAFVELESGIDGLIHVADLWMVKPSEGVVVPPAAPLAPGQSAGPKRIEHPNEVVKVGDVLDVVVASNDPGTHKISLHPAPTGDAANEAPQRIQLHRGVKVVVVSIESGGLGVRVLGATGRHARGFITSAATGTPRGTELRKLFPIGKELEAKIVEMDPKRGEIKLSIKALADETERSAYQQYRQTVARDAKFTFADLIAKKQPQK